MREGRNLGIAAAKRRRLQEISRSKQEKPRTRVRAMVLLMADGGMTGDKIAKEIGVSRRTVTETKRRWRRNEFEGLRDGKKSGRPAVVNRSFVKTLAQVAEEDPKEFGYIFRRWTAARLAEYMARKNKISVTPKWISILLKKAGFVWRRTKQTTRNLQNKNEIAIAKRRLERLKKGLYRRGQTMNSGMLTE